MTAAPALAAFDVNGRGMATCPAHEDRHRSLSVKEGSDGRALVKCHAGCTFSAVMAAAGLAESAAFAPELTSVPPRTEPEAIYTYRDAEGRPAYVVKRWGKRHEPPFTMHKPDGSSIGTTPRLPYRLPELTNADPSRVVFVVEGEKDADRLAALDMIATTNAGGAGKWVAEWAPHFAGKRVAIIPDHDEPGRKHAADVAASLRDVAREVRIVTLPDLDRKGADVSDWLDMGHDVDELRGLIRATAPEPFGTGEASLRDFLAERLDPPRWIVDGLVPVGPAVGVIVGAGKNGKSLAGLQLCIATAKGSTDWLGHPIDDGGPAVFIEYEGSRARLQDRARGMAATYGVLHESVPVSVIHRPDRKIDTDAGEAWLRRVCTGKVVCVVGPVAKACSILRENEPAEWQALAERLQRVADATGCAVMLVHHTRKPSVEYGAPRKVEDFFSSARGSNALIGAVDFALGVQRDPEKVDGTLYHLERDGSSGRLAYTFDPANLCIWPSDRPLTQPSREDRAEAVYAYVEGHPDCTRRDLAAALGVGEATIRNYLDTLGERVTEQGEGRETRRYRVA